MSFYDKLDLSILVNVMLAFLVYSVIQQFVYDYKMKSDLGEEE